MASQVLKCVNCNLVINEVLSFIQNKCDVMDENSLVRLCVTAFKPEEISAAKSLLFESVKTTRRNVSRKREGKLQRELEDIILLVKEVDPEQLPVFVARDLHKLPPVTFDHLDATRLLRDLIAMKNEIETIKDTYVPVDQFMKLKNEFINLQQTSVVNNFQIDNVNRKRGANKASASYACNYDSGPVGFLHISQDLLSGDGDKGNLQRAQAQESTLTTHEILSPRDSRPTVPRPPSVEREVQPQKKDVTEPSTSFADRVGSTNAVASGQLISQAAAQRALDKENNYDEEGDWETVQRKRYKNRFISKHGTCTEVNGKFRAANTSIPLFIDNVHNDTCVSDIVSYIKNKTGVEVTLYKLNTKQQRKHDCYKMFVPKHKLNLFMDCDIWPDGITFRRFIEFRKRENAIVKSGTMPSNLNINNG